MMNSAIQDPKWYPLHPEDWKFGRVKTAIESFDSGVCHSQTFRNELREAARDKKLHVLVFAPVQPAGYFGTILAGHETIRRFGFLLVAYAQTDLRKKGCIAQLPVRIECIGDGLRMGETADLGLL